MAEFTHISEDRVRMVDVGEKSEMRRLAVAAGNIYLRPETLAAIRKGTVIKGNVTRNSKDCGHACGKGHVPYHPHVPCNPCHCSRG